MGGSATKMGQGEIARLRAQRCLEGQTKLVWTWSRERTDRLLRDRWSCGRLRGKQRLPVELVPQEAGAIFIRDGLSKVAKLKFTFAPFRSAWWTKTD